MLHAVNNASSAHWTVLYLQELRLLPKPGAWMERFKTIMGFPMLATAAWLLSLKRLAYRMGIEIYSIAVRTELTKPDQASRDKEVAAIFAPNLTDQKVLDTAASAKATGASKSGNRQIHPSQNCEG